MNLKLEITRKVLDIIRPGTNEKDFKKFLALWWVSTRKKEKGGLRLTEEGFEALKKAEIECHRIRFYEPIEYTNQLIVRLDQMLNCPFYITKKEIHVFNDKLAIQLVLFNGNIQKFTTAKAKSLKSN